MTVLSSGHSISLMRVVTGHEQELLKSWNGDGSTFLLLGRFDLLSLRPLDRLEEHTNHVLSDSILSGFDLVVVLDAASGMVPRDLLGSPALVLTLLRVAPGENGFVDFSHECAVAARIRHDLPGAVVGHCVNAAELVVIQGSTSLRGMLDEIQKLRVGMSDDLSRSTSFIAVHPDPAILGTLDHDPSIRCSVAVRCLPTQETGLADFIGSAPETQWQAFGWQDATLGSGPMTIPELVARLMEGRKDRTRHTYDTSVSLFLPLDRDAGESDAPGTESDDPLPDTAGPPDETMPPSEYGESAREMLRKILVRLSAVQKVDVGTRTLLNDLAGVMSAASWSAEFGALGFEQLRMLQRIIEMAEKLTNTEERTKTVRLLRHDLRRASHHLALSVVQRAGGIEPHFDLGPIGLNLGTRARSRLVGAITAIPWCTFRIALDQRGWHDDWNSIRRTPNESDKPEWPYPFCLDFGYEYSPAYHVNQGALSLPDTTLLNPILEWWRITHEVGHAVSEALGFPDNIISKRSSDYVAGNVKEGLDKSPSGETNKGVEKADKAFYDLNRGLFIEELFAQWFDLVVAFRTDSSTYQKLIWTAWLGLSRPWETRKDYLARSLALYVYPQWKEWSNPKDTKETRMAHVREEFDELLTYLDKECSEFPQFCKDVTDKDDVRQWICDTAGSILMAVFDELRDCERLLEQGIPAYDELEKHVEMILQGQVVEAPIPNPARLAVALRLRFMGSGKPTLAQDLAFALSLWEHQAEGWDSL